MLATLCDEVPETVMPPPLGGHRDLLIHMAAKAREREIGGTLITCEHPRGLTANSGCQIPQRVRAVHGRGRRGLDGAQLISARDHWVGRGGAGRRELLRHVICPSRCPVRLSAICGPCLRALPATAAHGRQSFSAVSRMSLAALRGLSTRVRGVGTVDGCHRSALPCSCSGGQGPPWFCMKPRI